MVFRSTPVRRSISRCVAPWLASVSTVVFKCGFKRFTSAPFVDPNGAMMSCRRGRVLPDCRTLPGYVLRWGNLTWPQVGEFGWPPGAVSPVSNRFARPRDECSSSSA